MDYQKIYRDLMVKAKRQNRVKTKEHYFEKHHIIPECLFKIRTRSGPKGYVDGDSDDQNNLVLLTPREHFIAHVLLCKIYKNTEYAFKIGSALLFFFSKIINPMHPRLKSFAPNSKKYESYRIMGIQSISNANKGYINVRERDTGKYIGRISINDPDYISGKYVHHTKGRKISDIERSHRKPQTGSNNSNYKEMTEERKLRLFSLVDRCLIGNHLILKLLQREMQTEFVEFKKISRVWLDNNFGSIQNFIDECNKTNNSTIQYAPYFRNSQSYKKQFLSKD